MPTGSSLSPARVFFFSSDSSSPLAWRVLRGMWIFGFRLWEISGLCQTGSARVEEEGKMREKEQGWDFIFLLQGPGVQGEGEEVIYFLMISYLLFIINNCLYLFIINKQLQWLFIFVILLKVFPGWFKAGAEGLLALVLRHPCGFPVAQWHTLCPSKFILQSVPLKWSHFSSVSWDSSCRNHNSTGQAWKWFQRSEWHLSPGTGRARGRVKGSPNPDPWSGSHSALGVLQDLGCRGPCCPWGWRAATRPCDKCPHCPLRTAAPLAWTQIPSVTPWQKNTKNTKILFFFVFPGCL